MPCVDGPVLFGCAEIFAARTSSTVASETGRSQTHPSPLSLIAGAVIATFCGPGIESPGSHSACCAMGTGSLPRG